MFVSGALSTLVPLKLTWRAVAMSSRDREAPGRRLLPLQRSFASGCFYCHVRQEYVPDLL